MQKLMHSGNNWFRMHLLESNARISTATTPHPSHLHGLGAWQPLSVPVIPHLATLDICMHPVASETNTKDHLIGRHVNTNSNA
jgi:hypothetical protein